MVIIMKNNDIKAFVFTSVFMQLLHILRGENLHFIVPGQFPYILYYGTMILQAVMLIRYAHQCYKRIRRYHLKN